MIVDTIWRHIPRKARSTRVSGKHERNIRNNYIHSCNEGCKPKNNFIVL